MAQRDRWRLRQQVLPFTMAILLGSLGQAVSARAPFANTIIVHCSCLVVQEHKAGQCHADPSFSTPDKAGLETICLHVNQPIAEATIGSRVRVPIELFHSHSLVADIMKSDPESLPVMYDCVIGLDHVTHDCRPLKLKAGLSSTDLEKVAETGKFLRTPLQEAPVGSHVRLQAFVGLGAPIRLPPPVPR